MEEKKNIIGTIGHVDHGKTTLSSSIVKSLNGDVVNDDDRNNDDGNGNSEICKDNKYVPSRWIFRQDVETEFYTNYNYGKSNLPSQEKRSKLRKKRKKKRK